MNRTILIIAASTLMATMALSQIPSTNGFRLETRTITTSDSSNQLQSNSVIDIKLDPGVIVPQDILMGTGGGLSIFHPQNSTFLSYSHVTTDPTSIGRGSVSALDVKRDTIWAATAFTASTAVGPLPAGGGVGYSTDHGYNWIWFPQPVDTVGTTLYEPTTTNVQNVTYDLAITSYGVWIGSWAGGLRKFSFADNAWHLVVPDDQPFSALDHLNHRVFSVVGDDSVLWVGTAAGINKSTDSGATWQNFNSGADGISGNFVTALALQYCDYNQDLQTDTILWAATWQADSPTETNGVSVTKNGGLTWQVVLTDSNQRLEAHNFAFFDSVVYVATNLGLYKSRWQSDGSLVPWGVTPTSQMIDAQTGYTIADPEVYCALVYETTQDNTLIVGTAQGIAIGPNLGYSWSIFRTNPPVAGTYAYPNPFYARLYYITNLRYDLPTPGKVTVKVFDYAMDEVAVIADNKFRNAGQWEEQWDGRRSDGKPSATGVYYYSVEREGSSTVWGKVAVIY